ncbi:hypothetical protein RFA42_002286 [Vibrio vulnificus]|uniref:hypothetical protein n=1 Tax=Vibrio vulnificus TaxID=672 RepID=UPI0019D4828F|nr:hypothetical protein [Vibrio vulnificus]EKZ9201517.1 hypothetical protein [Vibrio vulnificus]MBN8111301.1 hypothetical protein [Vibrio vulnificus]MCA3975286.1 hypothetical protein [Vibrio vulnificus]HAS6282154.1 hypothetical protein [Vibrio vulnificus]HDY7967410.1 hypothetical protein [Vibrio vulnificus]
MFLNILIVTLLFSIFITPQSFGYLKLPLLVVIVLSVVYKAIRGRYVVNSGLFFSYYFIFVFLSLFWVYIGALYGHADQALFDSIRVYVIFMICYAVLALHVSNADYTRHADKFFSLAAFGIGFFCLYVLIDAYYPLSLLNDEIRKEMFLEIGVHDGYTQMNNVNIGSLSFILPFLFSSLLLSRGKAPFYLYFAIIIGLASAILASRRIILLLFVLTPLITLVINWFVNREQSLTKVVVAFYSIILCLAACTMMYLFVEHRPVFDGFTERLLGVFAVDDRSLRYLQHVALIDGFFEYQFFGSGFGGVADVIRNAERPWTYELTYSRLLFNSGMIGIAILTVFFGSYFFSTIRKIKSLNYGKNTCSSLLVGFVGVLLASTSNPYIGSFDFNVALSIIPLILNYREHHENHFT